MTRRAALFVAMSSFVLVAGCATANTAYLHIPPSARDHVASTDVVVPIKQNEIYMFIPSSAGAANAAGASFGLLGALVAVAVSSGIDASNAHEAEVAMQPVRTALTDFSFDNVLQADVKTALAREAWLHPGQFSVVKEVSDQKLDSLVTDSKSSAVLFVTTDYQLSKDGDQLTVTIAPCLFPITPELKAMVAAPKTGNPITRRDNALYCNTLAYRDVVPNALSDRDGNLALWAANNGGAMRSALQKASTKLTDMMVIGLESSPGLGDTPSKNNLPKKQVDVLPGYVVSSDESGSYIGFDGGRQMYLTKAAMTYKKPAPPHKQSATERAQEQKAQEKAARAAARGS